MDSTQREGPRSKRLFPPTRALRQDSSDPATRPPDQRRRAYSPPNANDEAVPPDVVGGSHQRNVSTANAVSNPTQPSPHRTEASSQGTLAEHSRLDVPLLRGPPPPQGGPRHEPISQLRTVQTPACLLCMYPASPEPSICRRRSQPN
jgi:hypothetical protein